MKVFVCLFFNEEPLEWQRKRNSLYHTERVFKQRHRTEILKRSTGTRAVSEEYLIGENIENISSYLTQWLALKWQAEMFSVFPTMKEDTWMLHYLCNTSSPK